MLANITMLDLSENPIGEAGVAALVNSPHARNLQKLELSACGIGLVGITALAESPHMANLRELRLSRNSIDLKGWQRAVGRVAAPGESRILLHRQRADRDRQEGAQGAVRRPRSPLKKVPHVG